MRILPLALTVLLLAVATTTSGQTCPELVGSELDGDGGFGRSIALSGDGTKLIVGRPQSSNPGTWSGGDLAPQRASQSWKVWPNPTAGVVRIMPPAAIGDYNVTLRNQLGQTVLTQRNLSGALGVLTLDAPHGVYQLHIDSEGEPVHSQSLVLER